MNLRFWRVFNSCLCFGTIFVVFGAFILTMSGGILFSQNAQAGSVSKLKANQSAERLLTTRNLDASLLNNLKWRCIGPAVPSGRVSCIAVDENNKNIIYAATATGGVWKTTNNGNTWEPVFEREGTISIGAVAVSTSSSNIVWVGTGESWNARSSSYGDGVYKSEDGGQTWKHMGLVETRYINWILIHPEDANVVYVAALGSLWGPNEERGLFKTTNGGKSWSKVLYINKHTGVQDVVMDPKNPEILYAASFQRERRPWNFIGGGPEGGIFKSWDGGKTWEELTNGLPKGDMGRIGLSICRTQPNIIYATIQAKIEESGTYRSDDYGASWECRNREVYTRSDFGKIRCDPNDPDRVYLCHVRLYLSEDGGRTFRSDVFGSAHGDWRAFWIDPTNSNHLVVGNDGGLYTSYDRGRNWDFMQNIPAAQFYAVGVDMREPFYYVYGGTQDNSTYGGPSGTRYSDGIRNSDWFQTTGGDGFYAQIDPTDPSVTYGESQYGVLYRFDTNTGEHRLIQPQQPLEEKVYRWNWCSPVLISHHEHNTLYFAANKVFRSHNRGDSWEVISPDLTRQLDAYSMPIMGKVWPTDAVAWHQATAELGTISTISESPLKRGLLAVGTDDGLIQVTQDDGENWIKIDRFPGVPERTWVSRMLLSNHNEDTIYATFDARRDDDFKPYVIKSTDFGKTWKSITNNLPEFGSVRVIVEHNRNPNLLFVGTETGVFVSITGGNRWVQLKNNLPTVMAWDMLIHPRENDLILATHGRSFWILDDITVLEELSPKVLNANSHLCSVRTANQFHLFNRGGHSDFTAANPPHGAIITYYINPKITKLPKVKVEILDSKDRLIQSLKPVQGKKGTGIQRLVWDLRHSLPFETESDRITYRRAQRGPFVLPGEYKVRLTVDKSEHVQSVEVKGDPLVVITPEDRLTWHNTLLTLAQMEGAVRAVLSTAGQAEEQLNKIQGVLKKHLNAPESLIQSAQEIMNNTKEILVNIRGERRKIISAQQEKAQPLASLIRRLYYSIEGSTALPTDEQIRLTKHCVEQLNEQIEKLNHIVLQSMPELNRQLTEIGVRWTPGRPIKPVEMTR